MRWRAACQGTLKSIVSRYLRDVEKHCYATAARTQTSWRQDLAGNMSLKEAMPEGLDMPIVSADGRFDNPWSTWKEKGFRDIVKWQWDRRDVNTGGWLTGKKKATKADFEAAFPLNAPDQDALQKPPADVVQATWIGHASVLVQMGAVSFLTDPVFAERCSPVQFAGPRRLVKAALDVDALPHIDFVVISHNHYDHLCHDTVQKIFKRFGDSVTWYVPLGLDKWFKSCGISNVVALNWWQEVQHGASKLRVACVPAQHWSSRSGMDRRQTLWSGWVVFSSQLRFYFAGDTGLCPVFSQIGKTYGPFDLAAIPTGAYHPGYFLAPQHVNPEEAVQIHQAVQSKKSMAIHCCTFCLTDEAMDEPPTRLVAAAKAAGLGTTEFVTLQHGARLVTAGGIDRNRPPLLGAS